MKNRHFENDGLGSHIIYISYILEKAVLAGDWTSLTRYLFPMPAGIFLESDLVNINSHSDYLDINCRQHAHKVEDKRKLTKARKHTKGQSS